MSTSVRTFSVAQIQALQAEVCRRLVEGEPLAVMCRDDTMPCVATVLEWQKSDSQFGLAVARAREAGYDAIAIEARDIIDGKKPDALGANDPSRDKARADVRLKLLACWDPRRYGQRLQHADADGGKLPDNSALVSELVGLLKPGAIKAPEDKGS